MQAGSLLAPGRYPGADVRQIFQRQSTSGAFGKRNEHLRNVVIHMLSKAGLLTRELLETALRRLGAAPLKIGAPMRQLGPDAFNFGPAVDIPVAISRDVDKAKVHAKPVRWCKLFGLRDFAANCENPLPLVEAKIAFALPEREQRFLMLSNDEWNLDATAERPDRDEVFAEAQDTLIVGLRSKLAKYRRDISINLERIGDLCDTSDCRLGGQPEVLAGRGVRYFMEVELPENRGFESVLRDLGTRVVAALKRLSECLRLFLGRLDLDRRNELHVFIYRVVSAALQEGSTSPPQPEGRGFRYGKI